MNSISNARLTKQNQITVPKSVRELLKILPGDFLVFILKDKDECELVVRRGEIRVGELDSDNN